MERYLDGDPLQGLVGKIPVPDYPAAPAAAMTEDRDGRFDWHDFYVSYDPATRQDKFYGSAQPVGSYVFDVTRPEQPKLITSITGAPGQTRDHTLVATPDGRYVITESHFQYRPLQLYDLKPGLDGEVQTISRPIAWTVDWATHAHNFEIRWPYVFVAAYEYGMQVITADGAKDPDRVLALFADSASVTIVSSGQLRSSRSAFRDALEALYGSIRKLEIVEDEVRVAALGPDAAILTATYAYERIALDSTVIRGRAAITYGCRRRNGEREIVHYHFSRAPGST